MIRAFSAEAPLLTIAQVAERTSLTRAVARRYLFTLQELGYVVRNQDRYGLTPRLLDLGFTYLSTIDVTSVVQPFMEQVTSALHESCSVSVLDGTEIVYIARVPAKRIMSVNLVVGSRLPAHTTSLGKVLLAFLPPAELEAYLRTAKLQKLTPRTISDRDTLRTVLAEVRQRGWAIANEETEDGVRTVAAPIFNRHGEVRAAINVSGHSSRVSLAQLQSEYLPVLSRAARGISEALGADLTQWASSFSLSQRAAAHSLAAAGMRRTSSRTGKA